MPLPDDHPGFVPLSNRSVEHAASVAPAIIPEPRGDKLDPSPAPAPGEAPPPAPQLMFQCPACHVTLHLPAHSDYDGNPAPCPHCASLILPPRLVEVPAPQTKAEAAPIYRPSRERATFTFR